MTAAICADASIFISAPVEKTFATARSFDAPRIVRRKGLLPGVRSVDGPDRWGDVGDRRRLTLTDGSGVEETLLDLGAQSYRYRVSGFSGPFRFLVKEAQASFVVERQGEGSILRWSYEFAPTSPFAAPVVSFIAGAPWIQWMDAALERIKDEAEAS